MLQQRTFARVPRNRTALAEQLRYPVKGPVAELAALHQPRQFIVGPSRAIAAHADSFADARVQASCWSAVAHMVLYNQRGLSATW